MDTSSLMIGAFLFAAFMFPILYVLLQQKGKINKSKKLLYTIAAKNNLTLDKLETIGNLSLGLDSTRRAFIYNENGSLENSRIIDLSKVGHIKIAKKVETSFANTIKKEKIIHLALELSGDRQETLAEITFYDENSYDSTDAEVRLHEAQKWDELLQKNLAS